MKQESCVGGHEALLCNTSGNESCDISHDLSSFRKFHVHDTHKSLAQQYPQLAPPGLSLV